MSSAIADTVEVTYFSDILCVWAWIAQRRLEELEKEFGGQVSVRCRYIDVFGDAHGKLETNWADRGGYQAYADHVQQVAEPYDAAPVHKDTWRLTRPFGSAPAHLFLKAIEVADCATAARCFAHALREAFFAEAQDITQIDRLLELCKAQAIDGDAVQHCLNSGRAMAMLMADYAAASSAHLVGSPSWVLNNGRQILYGNVGYRVISANVEELLARPQQEASWC